MKKAILFLAAIFCLTLMSTSAWATTYYSQTSGTLDPNVTSNWNTNRLGGGTSPANFISGDTFVVQGTGNGGTSPHSITTSAAWSISGAASKLQIENGATLQSNASITLAAATTFQIDNGGTYIHNYVANVATSIFAGTESFGATSNFEIRQWGGTATSSTSGLTTSLTASITVGGNNYFYGNLTINTTAFTGAFSPGLTGTVLLCSGNFTVSSTGSGASAIFRFATAAAGPTIVILGNYSQATGTKVDFNSSAAQTANTTLNLVGNYSLAGTASLDNSGSSFAAIAFIRPSGTQTVSVSATAVQPWMLWTVGNGTTSTNTVQLLSSLNVTGTTGIRIGSITINANATLDLNGFTTRIEGTTTGTVTITGTLTGTVASSKLLFSSSGTSTTTLTGAGTVNGSNLTIEYNHTGTGVNLISRDLTINTLTLTAGTLRLNATATQRIINLTNFSMAAGTLDTGSVDVTGNVTSVVNLTGNFSKTGGTVSNTSPSGLGLFVFKGAGAQTWSNTGTFQFASVTVTNNSTLTLNTAMAFSGVTGPLLTIDLGSAVNAGTNLISTASASSNFVVNGTLRTANTAGLSGSATTTIVSTNAPTVTLGSSSTIEYNGAAAQTVTARSDYANLTLNNSNGGTLNGNTTINSTLTLTSGALSIGANTLTLNGAISTTGGSLTGGSTSNLTFGGSGASTTLPAITLNNLTINRANGISLGGPVTVGGTLTLSSGALSIGANTLTLNGAIDNTGGGTLVGGSTSNIIVGGSGASTTLPAVTLNSLTLNRPNGITLGGNVDVSGTLTLTSGNLTTGSNTLSLGASATASRTAGYVIGNYKKIYSGTGSFTYDVGTNNGYSPLTANVTGGTLPADLTVKPTQTAQPQILTPSKALQRYWTLTEGGDLTADLTFNYLDPPDVPGTANETAFIVIKYDGANFTTPTGVVDFLNNKFTVPAVSSFSDWTLAEAIGPTAVKLVNFDATSDNGLVRIDWNTGYEARNLGFNLYREQNGKRTRVTPSMLAGSALLTGPRSVLTAGHSYTWFDAPAAQEGRTGPAQYWLEDVDINGTRTLHGPITPSIARASLRQTKQRQAEVLGQRQQIGAGTGLQINGWPAAAASIHGDAIALRADGSGIAGAVPLPSPQYIEPDTAVYQRQIADMAGVKFNVSRNGWYHISQPQLIAAGLDPNVNASHLQLFAGGIEVPIRVSGNGQQLTAGDLIEFYGTGADLPTDGTQTYYLVQGQGYGKRIMKFVDKDAQPLPQPSGPASFNYTLERKERLTFFPGLDNGEADNFFGQIITNNSSSPVLESLNVKHPYAQTASGAQAQLEVSLQGVTAGSHQVRVLFNGTDAGVINFAGTEHISQAFDVPAASVIEGDNVIQLSSLGGDADISLADTVRLTYAHAYAADNDALALSVGSEDTIRVKGFTSANVRVVDITDPNNSQELTPVINAQPDGSFSADAQVIGANPDGPHTLIVFADNSAAQPDSVRNSNPSHWAVEDTGADFLIISHKSLMGSVQPLADLRRSQGMKVFVIDVEDLYDEFSFGAHSPQAIHEFINHAANSWKVTPRYVLLVGDATYDPRNYLGQGANDMLPTKLLWATDMKTASDDWMADMDGNGVPELAVGRLPVRTASEASILVNKIINYVPGQSAQGALLVADHASDNDFEGASTTLGQQLPASVPVSVVNRGTQDANTVRSQIIGGINQGPQVVNYFGHGSVGLWTGAGLLTTGDAANLQNGNRLPLFTMMTCLNGYFQDVSGESLAESLLKAQNGGAVAVWASSGQTNMDGQTQAAQSFYQLLYGNQPITLGDAVRGAKSTTTDQNVRRSWLFFGDPTQRIR